MSPEEGNEFQETDLTLALPGGGSLEAQPKSGAKRGLSEAVDLKLGEIATMKLVFQHHLRPSLKCRVQALGWPPVRSCRKQMMKTYKYVKVAVDGAPFLRKVDLKIYNSYHHLLAALEDMFTCLTICNVANERKIIDAAKGVEYVPTYEDRDGDWMLIGDIPWKMFVESCKRLRLMKSIETIGLAPRTSSSSSTGLSIS